MTSFTLLLKIIFRGVFRTLSRIYDEAFVVKAVEKCWIVSEKGSFIDVWQKPKYGLFRENKTPDGSNLSHPSSLNSATVFLISVCDIPAVVGVSFIPSLVESIVSLDNIKRLYEGVLVESQSSLRNFFW